MKVVAIIFALNCIKTKIGQKITNFLVEFCLSKLVFNWLFLLINKNKCSSKPSPIPRGLRQTPTAAVADFKCSKPSPIPRGLRPSNGSRIVPLSAFKAFPDS